MGDITQVKGPHFLKTPSLSTDSTGVSEVARSFSVELWSVLLHALPTPATLATQDGIVVEANAAALRAQIDVGTPAPMDWTNKTLGVAGDYQLIAPSVGLLADSVSEETNDIRDHLLRQFFAAEGVLFQVMNEAGRIVEGNDAWRAISGIADAEVIDENFWDLFQPDAADDGSNLRGRIVGRQKAEGVLSTREDLGSREIHWSLERDDTTGFVFGVGRDITEERRMTGELRRLAFSDTLTGLANRARLIRQLRRELDLGRMPAVLFCDLDRFKVVNDSLGHAAGDELLRVFAARLADAVVTRRDDDDAIVARLGGDEFVVMLGNADQPRAVETAEAILSVVDEPFTISGRSVRIAMSVGVAMARRPGREQAEFLLGEADTAAYYAKERNRGGYVVHDGELQAKLERRFNVEAGLVSALADDRFEVHYQPIVEVPSAKVKGIEALVRWRDEHGQLHMPGAFLDIAQEAGLVDEIGDRVLFIATRQAAELRRRHPDLTLSVNATSGQIASPAFVNTVRGALKQAGLPAEHFILELTESAIVNDLDATIPVLEALRSSGVRIAIDDFGTGYSSLSYLQELPIDIVKIDRSFVARISHDPVACSVVEAVVGLCRALNLGVIVEGVEEPEQASVVERLGCRRVQGFLFHRPLDVAALNVAMDAEPVAY